MQQASPISAGFPAKIAMAIKLGGSGDLTNTANVVWKYEKGTAYVPSPILYGDYLYLTTDRGILTCLDARTGEVKYEGGRVPIPATFTASPVAFDGKILWMAMSQALFWQKSYRRQFLLLCYLLHCCSQYMQMQKGLSRCVLEYSYNYNIFRLY